MAVANVAAGTQQFYRPGMFDMLQHYGIHGKGKHARAKKGTAHGIHGHGRRGSHHDTLSRGASHDVWRNRDRMSGQR